jgi:hypothetical protein
MSFYLLYLLFNLFIYMKEEFLCYLWQYKLLNNESIRTTCGQEVEIISPGNRNYNSGPDFIAAKIRINKTIWAGNVEVHIKTSDWKHHNHHCDPAYSNIILHLVYHDDISSCKNDKIFPRPCLEIKEHMDLQFLKNFENLIRQKTWIPCEKSIHSVNQIIITNWLSRLLIERLERKSDEILHFLRYYNNDWEEVFYYFLAGNFGFKKNKTPFRLMSQKTPFSIIQKNKDQLFQLEAILFGQSGMLEEPHSDVYPRALYKEYQYLKQKYELQPIEKKLWKQSKLRPANFPCIRISQFAMLFNKSDKLFQKLINSNSIDEISNNFRVECSPYWAGHYVFDKNSKNKIKALGQDSIDNVIINTIIPFMFTYGRERMDKSLMNKSVEFLNQLPHENNQIIRHWNRLGIKPLSAADSQALIELKKSYCIAKRCLKCSIGHQIIKNK